MLLQLKTCKVSAARHSWVSQTSCNAPVGTSRLHLHSILATSFMAILHVLLIEKIHCQYPWLAHKPLKLCGHTLVWIEWLGCPDNICLYIWNYKSIWWCHFLMMSFYWCHFNDVIVYSWKLSYIFRNGFAYLQTHRRMLHWLHRQ